MKRIGIISAFNMNNVNYGNRLQAFALNQYVNQNYLKCKADSLYFESYNKRRKTKSEVMWFCLKAISYMKDIKNRIGKIFDNTDMLFVRMDMCNSFSKDNIRMLDSAMSWEDLCKSDYDAFIVGSDVVWAQGRYEIGRIRFLDFTAKKKFKKFSYAASFGRDWIPPENKVAIKQCLDDFSMISVREKSSISLLEGIGVEGVVHTLDPTLLLEKEEWESLEKRPNEVPDKYIFAYILGKDILTRNSICELSEKLELPIVTIPYACGEGNSADGDFGDIKMMDCSPEEWIWLIHHSRYIITDSFHGTVFSVIFEKEFLVVKRQDKDESQNINNRMIDFLDTIEQQDKLVDLTNEIELLNMIWEYSTVKKLVKEKKAHSIAFLDKVIELILNEKQY